MTRDIYEGFRAARPQAPELQNGWFKPMPIDIPDHKGDIFSGDVIYTIFNPK
jgi:adenylate cyclase